MLDAVVSVVEYCPREIVLSSECSRRDPRVLARRPFLIDLSNMAKMVEHVLT